MLKHAHRVFPDGKRFRYFEVVMDVAVKTSRGGHKSSEDHTILGFSHPAQLTRMRRPCICLLCDGTFKGVPAPFHQVLIIAIKDEATDCYTVCWFILLTGKHKQLYDAAFYHVEQKVCSTVARMALNSWRWQHTHTAYSISSQFHYWCWLLQLGCRLRADQVICDFEKGLIGAVQGWGFYNSVLFLYISDYVLLSFVLDRIAFKWLIGCYFHWTYALRRKLTSSDFSLPPSIVSYILSKMSILSLVDVADIPLALRFVVEKVLRFVHDDRGKEAIEKCSNERITVKTCMDDFFVFLRYFRDTWMKEYHVETWNVSAMIAIGCPIVNRTKYNPLENFNR